MIRKSIIVVFLLIDCLMNSAQKASDPSKNATIKHSGKPTAKHSSNQTIKQSSHPTFNSSDNKTIIPGADRLDKYLPLIKGKRIGIFANQTTVVGKTHQVDTLRKLGIDIRVIFGPEHGFRGTADAGEKVGTYIDEKTGIKVVSLYGAQKTPTAEDLKDVDIMIFDLQDVGCRFYTYINSMQDFLETALTFHKPLLL